MLMQVDTQHAADRPRRTRPRRIRCRLGHSHANAAHRTVAPARRSGCIARGRNRRAARPAGRSHARRLSHGQRSRRHAGTATKEPEVRRAEPVRPEDFANAGAAADRRSGTLQWNPTRSAITPAPEDLHQGHGRCEVRNPLLTLDFDPSRFGRSHFAAGTRRSGCWIADAVTNHKNGSGLAAERCRHHDFE